MFSYYGKLSTELYDFTKPVGQSINGDIEYYVERLSTVNGRVLEAGVGSGRFLIPLLEKGFTVDGIDCSKEMLHSCKQRCEKRNLNPNLYEGKLENFSLSHKYEAVVMPTGSFCLIDDREASVQTLRNFKNHLIAGGRIIVDLLLPNHFKPWKIVTESFSLPNGEGMTLESKAIKIDWINQTTLTYLKYEKWKDGRLMDTELQEFKLSWYGINEFKLLLKKIGFVNITCSSGYVYERYPKQPHEVITFEAETKE
ncbi:MULTISPECIES: class I SAM-dependent methyltransferase [Bacillus]|uniref:class I SAM-dependent methyltransferase n=1 Tax=Bacillus TaxID=1386 RepID=UPI00224313A9|nr:MULTISPECIES: class I SAM-dependent methyltransferase [Bacillus]MDN5388457.1 class I SAM-dependent methyltransferase [Bacillus sp. LB7]MEC1023181.1 class I SAM-dependent methyltransferase [Bacillus paralicheniformis]MEC1025747.1 class I SAM-dependent methyltransferase [Bacillus paralicheniformis]MEC1035837.1 class I SAM-dependent methyltransferase [Bacillus paralicheniformis]MEC1050025.1 class I SAM-dependent methyltransferase [Bacillus paralicheniformis]